jgi:hypothetical protein
MMVATMAHSASTAAITSANAGAGNEAAGAAQQ